MPKNNEMRVVALIGENTFLKEEKLRSIIDTLSLKGGVELTEFNGNDTTITMILDELRTYPFLNPQRIVVVRNAGILLPDAEEPLGRYVDNPADFSLLVLDFTKLDRRTALAKKLAKLGIERRFEQMREYELSQWMVSRAKSRYSKKLSKTDADFIVDMVGNNLGLLDSELAKIASLSPESGNIRRSEIENVVTRGRSRTVFMLTEAIENKNCPSALRLLEDILSCGIYDQRKGKTTAESAGIAPYIMHMLNWSIDRLWRANIMLSKGKSEQEIFDKLRIFGHHRKTFVVKLNNSWPLMECRRCHKALLNTDRMLKSSGSDNVSVLIETLLVCLCDGSKVQGTGVP